MLQCHVTRPDIRWTESAALRSPVRSRHAPSREGACGPSAVEEPLASEPSGRPPSTNRGTISNAATHRARNQNRRALTVSSVPSEERGSPLQRVGAPTQFTQSSGEKRRADLIQPTADAVHGPLVPPASLEDVNLDLPCLATPRWSRQRGGKPPDSSATAPTGQAACDERHARSPSPLTRCIEKRTVRLRDRDRTKDELLPALRS
jgi:hypothetical protein